MPELTNHMQNYINHFANVVTSTSDAKSIEFEKKFLQNIERIYNSDKGIASAALFNSASPENYIAHLATEIRECTLTFSKYPVPNKPLDLLVNCVAMLYKHLERRDSCSKEKSILKGMCNDINNDIADKNSKHKLEAQYLQKKYYQVLGPLLNKYAKEIVSPAIDYSLESSVAAWCKCYSIPCDSALMHAKETFLPDIIRINNEFHNRLTELHKITLEPIESHAGTRVYNAWAGVMHCIEAIPLALKHRQPEKSSDHPDDGYVAKNHPVKPADVAPAASGLTFPREPLNTQPVNVTVNNNPVNTLNGAGMNMDASGEMLRVVLDKLNKFYDHNSRLAESNTRLAESNTRLTEFILKNHPAQQGAGGAITHSISHVRNKRSDDNFIQDFTPTSRLIRSHSLAEIPVKNKSDEPDELTVKSIISEQVQYGQDAQSDENIWLRTLESTIDLDAVNVDHVPKINNMDEVANIIRNNKNSASKELYCASPVLVDNGDRENDQSSYKYKETNFPEKEVGQSGNLQSVKVPQRVATFANDDDTLALKFMGKVIKSLESKMIDEQSRDFYFLERAVKRGRYLSNMPLGQFNALINDIKRFHPSDSVDSLVYKTMKEEIKYFKGIGGTENEESNFSKEIGALLYKESIPHKNVDLTEKKSIETNRADLFLPQSKSFNS